MLRTEPELTQGVECDVRFRLGYVQGKHKMFSHNSAEFCLR